MEALEAIAVVVVTAAAALYLYRAYRTYREKRAERRVMEQTVADTPERRLASALNDERRKMPPEEFEKLKAEVFAGIREHNAKVGGLEDPRPSLWHQNASYRSPDS